MGQVLINDTLTVSYSDDFQVLSDAEKAGVLVSDNYRTICLKTTERHMIVSIAWKDVDGMKGFFSKLLTGNDLVKNMDTCYKKRLKPNGYKNEGLLSAQVGGASTDGLRFSYTAQGVEMMGESFVLKKDKSIYYFHCCYRREFAGESCVAWNALLGDAQWK